jgi:uncharacterized membrane protein YhhN
MSKVPVSEKLASAAQTSPLKQKQVRLGLLDPTTVARLVAGIWVLWAGVLLGGTLLSEFGRSETTAILRNQMLLVSHLGSSILLVTAAWIGSLAFNRSPAYGTVALVALGITLGAIGDFFNAGVLQGLLKLPDPVLGGIAAFALGHIAYITASVRVGRGLSGRNRGKRFAVIAFWQIVAIVAWFFIVYRGTNRGASILIWPALPYSLLLAGTAGVATSLATEDRRFVPLAIGAILFLTSDMILAFRMFQGDFPLAPHAVWLTYGPAQMLIAYSIGIIGRAECRRMPVGAE